MKYQQMHSSPSVTMTTVMQIMSTFKDSGVFLMHSQIKNILANLLPILATLSSEKSNTKIKNMFKSLKETFLMKFSAV